MAPFIIGIVLIGIGILLIYLRKKEQSDLLEIKFIKTSAIKDLIEMCKTVKDEIGNAGGFRQLSEIKGIVKCANPIKSELSNTACVYYTMNVEERYEETYYESDSKGNRVRRTRTGSTSVASNTQSCPFEVDDTTGRMMIDPAGAKIEGVQVLSRYEQNFSGGRVRLGGFSLNVGGNSGDRRILGYQFTESVIPLERRIYVLGDASDTSGTLQIQKPAEEDKPYIITHKSEEELTAGKESLVKMYLVGSIICFAGGIGAVAYGILFK